MHITPSYVYMYVCMLTRTIPNLLRLWRSFDQLCRKGRVWTSTVFLLYISAGMYSCAYVCLCSRVYGVGGRDFDVITLRRLKGSFRVTYLSAAHLCRYFYPLNHNCYWFDINLPLKTRIGTGLICFFFVMPCYFYKKLSIV